MYSLVIALLTALLVHICQLYWRSAHYWQRRHVPSPKRHWLWGNIEGIHKNLSFNDIFHNYYQQYRDTTRPFVGLYVFISPYVLITDPKLAKRVLAQDFVHFRNRGLYHNQDDLSGNMFTLDYDRWKTFRTKLSPTFTSGKLKGMLPNFLNAAEKLVLVMEEDIIGGVNILNVKDLMKRFTIEIIGSCAFGLQTNSLINPEGEFSKMTEKTAIGESNGTIAKFLMFSLPGIARKLRLKYMPQYLIEFYTSLVKNILETREQLKIRHNDVMGTLNDMRNQDSSKLTLNEITAQTLIFFQAGYETSAYTLTYALYELADRADLQEKARQEIYSVLMQYNNIVTYECLNKMPYLGQIVKETLRLYPISPLLIRQCTKDYKVPDSTDITIHKGQMIVIPAYSFQRDEKYYNQAHTFNPDNFAADRIDNILLSFGDGPRNCIGMRFANIQILIGLILLLKNFTFSYCERTEAPIIFKKTSVLLSPKNEIYLKVNKCQSYHED